MQLRSITRWILLGVLASGIAARATGPVWAKGENKKPSKTAKEKPSEDEDAEPAPGSEKDPTTFADAVERGKIAIDTFQAHAMGERMAEEQKDAENQAKERKEKIASEAAAYRMFRLALTLVDKGPAKDRPAIKEINEIRYFLAFLNFQRGQYFDAAVIGEFLARRAPESVEGRQGALIALAAYRKLFDESKQPEKDRVFETEHIQQIAEHIIQQWPKEDEAENAALTLLNFAIQQHQLDKAVEYLKRLPEASPRRIGAEIRTGQALWATYQRAPSTPAAERPTSEQLEHYRAEAEKILSTAVEHSRKQETVDPAVIGAMLSLAQIYLDQGENDKAVSMLEDKQFGPLPLVKAKHPATEREGFAVLTYVAALRAYVATQNVKDVTKIMNSLEKRFGVAKDPKAAASLTQIYMMLARELQQHLERLRKSGNKKELESVSNAFEAFLKRIVERGGGETFSSLSWVADTFYSLAVGIDDADSTEPPSERAKSFYANAVKGYEQILAKVAQDPKFAPDADTLLGIQIRAAISERRVGNYNTAIKLIAQALETRPKMITAQVEGAETYQISGPTDSDGFLKAISGGEKNAKGENTIWGWGKLAKMTQDDKRFADTFFLARYKIPECRYLFAMKAAEKAKHDKYIDMSKKELSMIYRLYPKLGGPEWFKKYDDLAKRVQTELGEKSVGIEGFKDAETTAGK